MADIFTPEKRSECMRAIRSTNTKPERLVRSLVHALGFRFRIHRDDLPGKPDVVLPRLKKIIFVHGCFWHGHQQCRVAHTPKSNTSYWTPKLERTVRRDARNQRQLRRLGWSVMVLWECQLKDVGRVASRLERFLNKPLRQSLLKRV